MGMNISNERIRVIAFGVANLVIAAFNVIFLLTLLLSLPLILTDQTGVYRGSPSEPLMWTSIGVYGSLSFLGTILPALAGVLLLMGKRIGYFVHLLAVIPGGLLFFPPLGLGYIPIAFIFGRGEAMRAGLGAGS